MKKPLGECAGELWSRYAPWISVRRGARLRIYAVHTIGDKSVKAPDVTSTKSVLTVVRRDNKRGVIVFRAQSAGRDLLIAHTKVCNSPKRGSVSHCVLVHVRVKP